VASPISSNYAKQRRSKISSPCWSKKAAGWTAVRGLKVSREKCTWADGVANAG